MASAVGCVAGPGPSPEDRALLERSRRRLVAARPSASAARAATARALLARLRSDPAPGPIWRGQAVDLLARFAGPETAAAAFSIADEPSLLFDARRRARLRRLRGRLPPARRDAIPPRVRAVLELESGVGRPDDTLELLPPGREDDTRWSLLALTLLAQQPRRLQALGDRAEPWRAAILRGLETCEAPFWRRAAFPVLAELGRLAPLETRARLRQALSEESGAGLEGAIEAAGRLGDPDLVSALASHADAWLAPRRRLAATRALACLRDSHPAREQLRARVEDSDQAVREAAMGALLPVTSGDERRALARRGVAAQDPAVQLAALTALVGSTATEDRRAVRAALPELSPRRSPDRGEARGRALDILLAGPGTVPPAVFAWPELDGARLSLALASRGPGTADYPLPARALLVFAQTRGHPALRRVALRRMLAERAAAEAPEERPTALFRPAELRDTLLAAIDDPDRGVALLAVEQLGRRAAADPFVVDALETVARDDPRPSLRAAAIGALAERSESAAAGALADPSPSVREAALGALERHGGAGAFPALVELAEQGPDEADRAGRAARTILARLKRRAEAEPRPKRRAARRRAVKELEARLRSDKATARLLASPDEGAPIRPTGETDRP